MVRFKRGAELSQKPTAGTLACAHLYMHMLRRTVNGPTTHDTQVTVPSR